MDANYVRNKANFDFGTYIIHDISVHLRPPLFFPMTFTKICKRLLKSESTLFQM